MVRPGSVLEVGQLVGPVSGLQHAHAWVYTRSEEIRTFITCMNTMCIVHIKLIRVVNIVQNQEKCIPCICIYIQISKITFIL